MKTASFTVEVTAQDRVRFAELSGDWNPLHTDEEYASRTTYGRCVLHGAFSAGLFSRLAGMFIPGRDCLLHGMRLRFISPALPPQVLRIEGRLVQDDPRLGEVVATVSDVASGRVLVEGGYTFSHHGQGREVSSHDGEGSGTDLGGRVLVTGASGGLGRAILQAIGEKGFGVSRSSSAGWLQVPDLERIDGDVPLVGKLSAIVHCAWPEPDNTGVLDGDARMSVEHHVAAPTRQILALARLLRDRGRPGATLIVVGSSFASPGRHAWRMPLYSLAKGMIPTLVRMLALELGGAGMRVVGITLDVVAGGMNRNSTATALQSHADRTVRGELPTMEDAAEQVRWILENPGWLISGGMVDLTGGAVP